MEKQKENVDKKRVLILLVAVLLCVIIFLEVAFNFGVIHFSLSDFLLKTFSSGATDNESTLVQFLNVGQGDCTIIKVKDNCAVIDFGPEDDSKRVYKGLKKLGVEDVDLAVVTHLHKDHFGGFLNLPRFINVKNMVVSNIGADDMDKELCDEFFKTTEQYKVKVSEPNLPMKYELGEASLEIFYEGEDQKSENNRSLIILVRVGDAKLLFTGDAEGEVEKEIIEKFPNLTADVLKLGHHGSNTSTTSEFISKINPSIAVASAGYNNFYNHPSDKTVGRLENAGIKYYRTDLDGNITLYFDKNKILVETERQKVG